MEATKTGAKTWKPPTCPSTHEWVKKMYTYAMEIYSDIKKNAITPFAATWTQLDIIMLSAVRPRKTNTA